MPTLMELFVELFWLAVMLTDVCSSWYTTTAYL